MLQRTRPRPVVDRRHSSYHNHLLRSAGASDLELLSPYLKSVELPARKVVERSGEAIEQVVFLEAGIVSVVARAAGGRHIEAGLIGPEGMTGIGVVMGDDRSAHECSVQVAGRGASIAADTLRRAMSASATLRAMLLRYVETFMIQTAHTALANGRGTIEERLARWLLMAQDRVGGNQLPLTHDLLALMLGVRRAGVTDAIHRLEGEGVIRARRGLILVRDRDRLEAAAGGSYGGPEQEYRRLLGVWHTGY
jgi:CRP-like cAMP-binding protein